MNEPWEAQADSDSSPDDPQAEMTLSQEELVIATELVQTGRARLIKRVEVESVTRTIELRREVLEIERLEPLPATQSDGPIAPDRETDGARLYAIENGPLAPGSLQNGTVEIVLMQEEVLITTQMVPRERVRLTKQIATESRKIDADLNTERVDLEQRP